MYFPQSFELYKNWCGDCLSDKNVYLYACCPTKVLYKTGVEIVYLIRMYIYMHAVQQRYYIELVWRLFI